ncbi:peptidase S41 [Paenibacillus darwinianus]|uniref:Peptidase S41 n=1 Tax=Paenibacillus darwinianus TaxID=1380763 RepID=A0A9W5W851_9BACL|nr:S41 family peptidase [Paenibacillus darwinianus]EXX89727.1 peptidase S41 [Paenibacillus darwinianus]EXX89874.1 peptidase S41 [Paenibacillus darwinianus]EXX90130.1 peptidase S41 [Paenibacillus darwinianus]
MYPSPSTTGRRRWIAFAIAGAVAVGAIGFAGGRWWTENRYPMLKDPAFANLDYTYKEIMQDYLNGAKSSELIHGAAEGMTASLDDPYSEYFTGQQGEDYVQHFDDQIVGIGVEIRQEDGQFIINSALKGAPAEQAGLLKGDAITAVDGVPMRGKTLSELVKQTRGVEGTKVKITIVRVGLTEPFDVTLIRKPVPIRTVTSKLLPGGVGMVQISRFAEKTDVEFNQAVDSLLDKGMKGLLLDLRMNPGGLVDSTIGIANRLVPKDKVLLQVVNKNGSRKITYRSEQKEPWTIPIVVLIDESSASSAEVLAAALRDSAGAKLVGVKSFGKGIVQTFRQFGDGSVLKLTESQWRTPSGKWIHEKGIEPDVKAVLPAYARLPVLPTDEVLKEGAYGQGVKTLEEMLMAVGYDPGNPEGIFDADTAAAVEQFQRDEKLTPTGMMSGRTAFKLMDRLRAKLAEDDPQVDTARDTLQAIMTKQP